MDRPGPTRHGRAAGSGRNGQARRWSISGWTIPKPRVTALGRYIVVELKNPKAAFSAFGLIGVSVSADATASYRYALILSRVSCAARAAAGAKSSPLPA